MSAASNNYGLTPVHNTTATANTNVGNPSFDMSSASDSTLGTAEYRDTKEYYDIEGSRNNMRPISNNNYTNAAPPVVNEKTNNKQNNNPMSRKKVIIIIAVIAFFIVAAAVAIPVGVVYGLRDKTPSHLAGQDEVTTSLIATKTPGNKIPSAVIPTKATRVSGAPNSVGTAAQSRGNRLVVIGASYCDNGHARPNQYKASLRKSPYVGGRSSNGPVWVEYLRDMMQSIYGRSGLIDFAYAGATASNAVDRASVPDGIQQLSSYLQDINSGFYDSLGSRGRTMIIVHIGLNEVFSQFTGLLRQVTNSKGQYRKVTDDLMNPHLSALRNAVSKLTAQINTVRSSLNQNSQLGRHDLIYVPIPPVRLLPVIRFWTKGNADLIAAAQRMSDTYNQAVISSVSQMTNYTNGNALVIDTTSFFTNGFSNLSSLGVSDVMNPCVIGDEACSDPSSRMFWDSVHLTTSVHQKWAQYIIPALTSYWANK